MKRLWREFLVREDGLTMVEYAVAAALVSTACILAFTTLGTAIGGQIAALAGVITAG